MAVEASDDGKMVAKAHCWADGDCERLALRVGPALLDLDDPRIALRRRSDRD